MLPRLAKRLQVSPLVADRPSVSHAHSAYFSVYRKLRFKGLWSTDASLSRSPAALLALRAALPPRFGYLLGPLGFPFQLGVPPLAYETPPPHSLLPGIGGPPAAMPSDWSPWMMVTSETPPSAGAGVWGHCSAVLGFARLEPSLH